MKKLIYIFLTAITFSGCAKELSSSMMKFDQPIEYSKDEIQRNLTAYSNYFYSNNSDLTIDISFNDYVADHGKFTMTVYTHDRYNRLDFEKAEFKFGDLLFQGHKDGKKISFVPPGAESKYFAGSRVWYQQINNIDMYLEQDIEVLLDINSERIVGQSLKVPGTLSTQVVGGIPSKKYKHYKIVDRNNLQLNWHKDESNQNGVLVMMRYDGNSSSTIYGEKKSQGGTRLILLEDDGSQILPLSLFEDVPDNGFVEMEIWRGSVGSYPTLDGGLMNLNCISKSIVFLILE